MIPPLEASGYERECEILKSIQDKQHLHSPPDKTTNFAPTDIPKSSKQEQPPVQNEIQQKVKKM